MRSLRPVLGAILVWLLSSGTGWTQAVAGSQLAGVVRDSSGGVLPGASVTITKTDTGMTRTIVTGPDGGYVFPNLPVGPYQLKVALAGLQHLRAGRHRPAGQHQPDGRGHAERRQPWRTGHGLRQYGHGRNTLDGRGTGHRQRAGQRDSAQRPPGHGADFPVRSRDVGAGRGSQHQQELSDGHDFGRRRPGQRHDVHHGRRDAQRSVQQPEPADAVPRRDPGVQGRDQLVAGALRASRRLGGQRRDQVGIESLQRQRVRVRPELPVQRPQLLRARARHL